MATLRRRFHYWLNNTRRNLRYWFPSPAEMKFVELMGGRVLRIRRLTGIGNHYPFAFVWWRGRFLRHEYMKREVRIGGMYADFVFETPHYRKCVEIDGREYHTNVVREQNRDDYLTARGYKVMHIWAEDLWHKPTDVARRVKVFLAQ